LNCCNDYGECEQGEGCPARASHMDDNRASKEAGNVWFYEPPRKIWEPSHTELMLQIALLYGKPGVGWDGILIVAGCLAWIAVPYLLLAWSLK